MANLWAGIRQHFPFQAFLALILAFIVVLPSPMILGVFFRPP
jgi:hypothetical protein